MYMYVSFVFKHLKSAVLALHVHAAAGLSDVADGNIQEACR